VILFGVYAYIIYKMVVTMKDMHSFKGKEKKDIDEK